MHGVAKTLAGRYKKRISTKTVRSVYCTVEIERLHIGQSDIFLLRKGLCGKTPTAVIWCHNNSWLELVIQIVA